MSGSVEVSWGGSRRDIGHGGLFAQVLSSSGGSVRTGDYTAPDGSENDHGATQTPGPWFDIALERSSSDRAATKGENENTKALHVVGDGLADGSEVGERPFTLSKASAAQTPALACTRVYSAAKCRCRRVSAQGRT